MPKIFNLIKQKFNRLIVIHQAGKNKWGEIKWLCLCDCGNQIVTLGKYLRNNDTKSCGCLNIEKTIKRSTKHNHSKRNKITKTYQIWKSMRQRCTNPNNKRYGDYGGRKITVCKRWMKFENFLQDMGERPEGYSIHRKNNNKGYYKSNCKWATRTEQARNKRNNHLITYKGKTQCLASCSEAFDISYSALKSRLQRGSSVEEAITALMEKKGGN